MIYFVRLRDECIKLKLETQQYGFYQSVESTFLFVFNLEDGSKHRMAELEDDTKYTKVNE